MLQNQEWCDLLARLRRRCRVPAEADDTVQETALRLAGLLGPAATLADALRLGTVILRGVEADRWRECGRQRVGCVGGAIDQFAAPESGDAGGGGSLAQLLASDPEFAARLARYLALLLLIVNGCRTDRAIAAELGVQHQSVRQRRDRLVMELSAIAEEIHGPVLADERYSRRREWASVARGHGVHARENERGG